MNSRCRNDVRLHIQNVTESLILEIPTPCVYVVYTAQFWFKSTQGLWILRRSPLSSFRLYFSTIIACAITSSRAKNVVCLKTPLPCRTHPMQNAMCGLIRAFQMKHLPKTGFVPLVLRVPLVAPGPSPLHKWFSMFHNKFLPTIYTLSQINNNCTVHIADHVNNRKCSHACF